MTTINIESKEYPASELDSLLMSFVQKTVEKGPDNSLFNVFRLLELGLPSKIPHEANDAVLEAVLSSDINIREAGRRVTTFLNARSILSAVEKRSGSYSEGEKEDVLMTALVSVEEHISKLSSNYYISMQLYNAAARGVADYIAQREGISVAWVTKRAYELFEFWSHSPGLYSGKEIEDLAESISSETGVPKSGLLEYFRSRYFPAEVFDTENDPHVRLLKGERNHTVGDVLNSLPRKEERVLSWRFGLGFESVTTLDDIGRIFGRSKENIRKIEAKALRRLRRQPFHSRLVEYLELNEFPLPEDKCGRERQSNLDMVLLEKREKSPYALENFGFDPRERRLLEDCGIKEIGDFFSASPEEILESWSLNPGANTSELKYIIEHLYKKLRKSPVYTKTIYHVVGASIYRHGYVDVLSARYLDIFTNACDDLFSFFDVGQD